ncbi:MAG: type I-C CRISPR-associated protein Cas8c/Csd1 [Candidatus Methanomethylophilaceae archaeon]|nr:type I-C CRISPR-associated protein Cas8c/Csd1 [Candidatus Methanomethylophilaceae archaeon]MBR6870189.1 type I-C CRISPR-associated protein Cas8c/Csd1 [Candidatus Methanomethylophilaceae archaeon]
MGWMDSLIRVYDACVGNPEYTAWEDPLLPICHISVQAHIEVTVGIDGRFVRADAIPKGMQTTTIPCTEGSAGRTSGLSPHPLSDKLQYLLDDYPSRVPAGLISKKGSALKSGFRDYMVQIDRWCSSEHSCGKVRAVRDYMRSGRLLEDLERFGVVELDEDGRFKGKDDAQGCPLFSVSKITGGQEGAFVRWRVEDPGSLEKDTWKDPEVQRSWIGYYMSQMKDRGLCYVTGELMPLASNHPSKIRNPGDKAKIISSNDTSGFVFRGRFENSDQACGVGYEATQKAHSALRWLISRQGYTEDTLCVVSWANAMGPVLNPAEGAEELFEIEDVYMTGVEVSRRLNMRIRGYNTKLATDRVTVMELDSATPGRMSILMHRELSGSDFIERIDRWHTSCAWTHRYYSKKGEDGKPVRIAFVGAPSPRDIALAAYGHRAEPKVVASTVKRILPCILDGTTIPLDIVENAVRKASSPLSMEEWQWRKTLSIACSMFKNLRKGEYDMTLEKERCTRDYLYGRLLAVADALERSALRESGETRQTTAVRMMQRFSEFPYSTWRTIELALVPYRSRLGAKSVYYDRALSEIMEKFDSATFADDRKLSGEFLLGYHCQINELYRKKSENGEEKEE